MERGEMVPAEGRKEWEGENVASSEILLQLMGMVKE